MMEEAGELAQHSTACFILAEEQNSAPSTHVQGLTTAKKYNSRQSDALSGHLHTQVNTHTVTYTSYRSERVTLGLTQKAEVTLPVIENSSDSAKLSPLLTI